MARKVCRFMLGQLYTEDITVKLVTGDKYKGFTTVSKVIKGAIFAKVSRKIESTGTITTTDNVLNTNEELPITSLVTYQGKDCPLVSMQTIKSHMMGVISHYEYKF